MYSSVYVSAGMWADNKGVSWQVSLILFCELTCALLALAWPPPNHGLVCSSCCQLCFGHLLLRWWVSSLSRGQCQSWNGIRTQLSYVFPWHLILLHQHRSKNSLWQTEMASLKSPSFPYALAYNCAAKLAERHSAMPLSSSGGFAVGRAGQSWLWRGGGTGTGLASGTSVNSKNSRETTVYKLHRLGTLAHFRFANTLLTYPAAARQWDNTVCWQQCQGSSGIQQRGRCLAPVLCSGKHAKYFRGHFAIQIPVQTRGASPEPFQIAVRLSSGDVSPAGPAATRCQRYRAGSGRSAAPGCPGQAEPAALRVNRGERSYGWLLMLLQNTVL